MNHMFVFKKKKPAPKKKTAKKPTPAKKTVTKPATPKNEGKLSEADISERIEEGAIRVIVTFEIVGKPKTHVETALKQYMENIKQDGRITLLAEEYAEALEQEDGIFSTFCEAEMLINNIDVLPWIAINFSPASIEILEPAEKKLTAPQLNSWLNDLVSKMHELGMQHRDVIHKNQALNASMNALIKNALISATELEERTPEQLQKIIGIHKDQLKPFLENLVEKGRLTEKKGKYKTA